MTTHFFFTGLSNGRPAFIGRQSTIFSLCSTYGPSGLQAWPSAGPHPICFLALIPASLLFIILCCTGLSNGRLALSWPPGRSSIIVLLYLLLDYVALILYRPLAWPPGLQDISTCVWPSFYYPLLHYTLCVVALYCGIIIHIIYAVLHCLSYNKILPYCTSGLIFLLQ